MKKKFLFTLLLLATMLPTALSAQDDGDLQFENADYVIRCVPSQTRTGVVTNPMAWPLGGIDMNTPTPLRSTTQVNGQPFNLLRYEVLFTITSVDDATKTGTVALGAKYTYNGSKDLGSFVNSCNLFVTNFYANNNGSDATPPSSYYVDGDKDVIPIIVPAKIFVNTDDYRGYTFTVTALSDEAFLRYTGGTPGTTGVREWRIYLPNTVTSIGNESFGGFNKSSFPLNELLFYDVDTDGCTPKRDANITATPKEQSLGKNFVVGTDYNNVATIGDSAFYGKSNMRSLPVSPRLQSIGTECFKGCTGLVQNGTIDLSGATSLTALPDGIFEGFYELESLHIPSNITTVGAIWGTEVGYGFAPNYNGYLSDGRTSFNLTGMENVTHLDLRAFNRPGITSFTLPPSVTDVTHGYIFTETWNYRENDFLTSADFSKNTHVTEIPAECFYSAKALTSVNFGTAITSIGDNAFYGTKALTSITLPSTITQLGERVFYNSGLNAIDMSATGVSGKLPKKLFMSCVNLNGNSIKLPSNITAIGDSCFHGNESLTSLSFLNNTQLTTIGEGAFEQSGINSIDGMPATLERIEAKAFSNCALKGEFNLNTQPWISNIQYIGEGAFADNGLEYLKLNAATDYNDALQIHNGAFGEQVSEFTVEFDEACTTVPAYIKGCPFSNSQYGYLDDNEEIQPTCLRVIVPIGSVNTYHSDANMGQVLSGNYRVKFRWGTFTDEQLKDDSTKTLEQRSYYDLLNITPQQRLIATSAWKNDIMDFRPAMWVFDEDGSIKGKGVDFDPDAMPMKAGRRKATTGPKAAFYMNTADYWDETNKKATVLPDDEDFFNADQFAFNVADNDALAAFKSSDAAKQDASYPKSLMPYTIHSFHSNHGNEEVEQIGRKAVTDGIVPYGTGIIIDFPRPGYYLVPPAALQADGSNIVRAYPVMSDDGSLGTPEWQSRDNVETPMWWDRRNPIVAQVPDEPKKGIYLVSYDEWEQLQAICSGLYQKSPQYNDELILSLDNIAELELTADEKQTLDNVVTAIVQREAFDEWDHIEQAGYTLDTTDPNDWYYQKSGEQTKYKGVSSQLRMKLINGQEETIYMFQEHIRLKLKAGTVTIDESGELPSIHMNGQTYTMCVHTIFGYNVYTSTSAIAGSKIDVTDLTRENLSDRTLFRVNTISAEDLQNMLIQYCEIYPNSTLYWYDIDEPFTDYGQLYADFTANHNPDTDHNVIIGLPDSYPIFPYWAESPYPFQDAAHDVAHANLNDRFVINNAGDELNPLNFRYARYGRMGKGAVVSGDADPTNYGTFVNMKHVEAGTDHLDNDIHYVNFVVSKGYFVQVNTNPLVPGNGYNEAQWRDYAWTKPNRAYFSVSRAHLPHIFSNSNDGKLAIFIIPENGGETTAIGQPTTTQRPTANDWYTLQGVRLTQKPTQPGIYIHNGRKEVVK